jgi:hypothetical protein
MLSARVMLRYRSIAEVSRRAAHRKLNAMLPMALAHSHTVQNACSAPFIPGYMATFRLHGSTLDWAWPGVDKYDRAGAGAPKH